MFQTVRSLFQDLTPALKALKSSVPAVQNLTLALKALKMFHAQLWASKAWKFSLGHWRSVREASEKNNAGVTSVKNLDAGVRSVRRLLQDLTQRQKRVPRLDARVRSVRSLFQDLTHASEASEACSKIWRTREKRRIWTKIWRSVRSVRFFCTINWRARESVKMMLTLTLTLDSER